MVEFRGQWPIPDLSWYHRWRATVCICVCVHVCECLLVGLLLSSLGKGNQFPCRGDLICRSRAQDGFITRQIDHCHTHMHTHRVGNLYEVKRLVKWQSYGVDLKVTVGYFYLLPSLSLWWSSVISHQSGLNNKSTPVHASTVSLFLQHLKLQLYLGPSRVPRCGRTSLSSGSRMWLWNCEEAENKGDKGVIGSLVCHLSFVKDFSVCVCVRVHVFMYSLTTDVALCVVQSSDTVYVSFCSLSMYCVFKYMLMFLSHCIQSCFSELKPWEMYFCLLLCACMCV